ADAAGRRRGSGSGLPRRVVGSSLVVAEPVRALALLHLGLVDVATTLDECVSGGPLGVLDRRVVAVVVLLDDLERPATLEHVASDDLLVDAVGDRIVTGRPQHLDGLADGQV